MCWSQVVLECELVISKQLLSRQKQKMIQDFLLDCSNHICSQKTQRSNSARDHCSTVQYHLRGPSQPLFALLKIQERLHPWYALDVVQHYVVYYYAQYVPNKSLLFAMFEIGLTKAKRLLFLQERTETR